jgi:DNA repair protein RecO (recombination protein O)
LCDAVPEALPDEELFELLRVTLSTLDAAPDDNAVTEMVGAWFEARFLAQSGYAPTLGRCVACGEKIAVAAEETSRLIEYSPQLGGTLCAGCALSDPSRLSVSVQALRVLRKLEHALAPPALETLNEWQVTRKTRLDLRLCLRRSLAAHLEIRLRSQRYLDDLLATNE